MRLRTRPANGGVQGGDCMQPVEPTPEEIRMMCLKIQAEWTEADRLARVTDDEARRLMSGWRPPDVTVGN